MSTTDNAATIAAIASSIQTVGEARAALGKVAELLQQGYSRVDGRLTGSFAPVAAGELRAAARSRLDVVNNYAHKTYESLSSDDADQADQIGILDASRVGLSLAQAQDALKDIEAVEAEDIWNIADLLKDSVANAAHLAGSTAGSVIQTAGNAVAGAGSAVFQQAWPVLLVVAGAAILYVFRAPLLRVVGRATA